MAIFTPPPPVPQRGDRATFSGRVDAFLTWMAGLIGQLNTFLAQLTTLAAGGAYSIPYQVNVGPGYMTFLGGTSQSTATQINLDFIAANGANYKNTILSMATSSSQIKGHVRLQKLSDPSKWVTYSVTGINPASAYAEVMLSAIDASSSNPFNDSDQIMIFFQRAGDKGEPGSSQAVKFSDRKAAGSAGGTVGTTSATTVVRTLNTTEYNTITSGVSLSTNRFTLPAGTYDISGRSPAAACSSHKVSLWNVTSGAVAFVGSSAYAGPAGAQVVQTDSQFSGRMTFSTPQTFEVRHSLQAAQSFTGDLGVGGGVSGQPEIFTEVIATKVL